MMERYTVCFPRFRVDFLALYCAFYSAYNCAQTVPNWRGLNDSSREFAMKDPLKGNNSRSLLNKLRHPFFHPPLFAVKLSRKC